MKDYGFKIKVSDLLINPGQKDIIKFENKFSTNIENLSEKGIKGKIQIQSISDSEIILDLQDIELEVDDECEICGKEFKRKIFIDEYSVKFRIGGSSKLDKDKNEEEFEINAKDDTINVGEIIDHSIFLEEPIVIKCLDCIQNTSNIEESDENIETKTSNKINWV